MKKRYYVLIFVLAFAAFFWSLVQRAGAPLATGGVNAPVGADIVPSNKAYKEDVIVVDTPTIDQTVGSPLVIRGRARGTWFFEGSFPITVVNWDGLIIGEGYATAQGEWMTEDFVPFRATVNYALPADMPYMHGYLILRKDNPSGEPKFDDSLEFKINF